MRVLSNFLFAAVLICIILLPAYSQTVNSNDIASTSFLNTDWGYGTKENVYNQAILQAIQEKWGNYELPVYPILIKATIAVESAFCPDAISPTGYAGLMQLGTNEASNQGLSLQPHDERLVPEKNITAALGILKVKHNVILHPLELYPNKPWAIRVNNFYYQYGYPSTYQQWMLTLAAYNGGGATVVRAMNYAIIGGKDPRVWENLLNQESPKSAPLYKAIKDIFGGTFAMGKYYQTGEYPVKIFKLVY